MAFTIPEPFVWDESFKVDYEKLDEQHRGLFQAIFNLAARPGDGGALTHLKAALTYHFTTEENLMAQNNLTDLPSHKTSHDQFLSYIAGLSAPVTEEQVNYIKNWYVNHVKGPDFQYKQRLG